MDVKPKLDITTVMSTLDKWVKAHGSGRYMPPDYPSRGPDVFTAHEDFGMQQVRDEIEAFVKVLLDEPRHGGVLETGLGHCGSSHYLWRQLYANVSTIEVQYPRLAAFQVAMRQWNDPLPPTSLFFWGDSCSTRTLTDVYTAHPDGVDLLFIDGNHDFGGILGDYLLYSPLVHPGGIVAFHDAISKSFATGQILESFTKQGITVNYIVKSTDTGIAWIRK